MIIYKIQESGRATDFMFSQKCPDGWQSIKGDRIPEDISQFHEQKYIDAEALRTQKQTAIQLRKEAEYHFMPNCRFPADVDKWKEFCAKLDIVISATELVAMPEKPYGQKTP